MFLNPHYQRVSSQFPAWIYDLATRTILDVNEAAIREYGYSRTEFLNMSVLEIRSLAELSGFI
jgi:PAS domain-containing protein